MYRGYSVWTLLYSKRSFKSTKKLEPTLRYPTIAAGRGRPHMQVLVVPQVHKHIQQASISINKQSANTSSVFSPICLNSRVLSVLSSKQKNLQKATDSAGNGWVAASQRHGVLQGSNPCGTMIRSPAAWQCPVCWRFATAATFTSPVTSHQSSVTSHHQPHKSAVLQWGSAG